MTTRLRILVIDDEKPTRDLLEKMLTARDFMVLAAGGGKEGVEIAKREKPDAILLDMLMPGMNGAETMDALRNEVGTRDIPIIFLSALEDRPEDVKIVQQLGAKHFLNKDSALDVDAFVAKIVSVVEEGKK